jgi:two-component system OmpR family sensor kinase
MQYHLQQELAFAKMRQTASQLSAGVTHAHMHAQEFDFEHLHVDERLYVGIFNAKEEVFVSNLTQKVHFEKREYQASSSLFLVDTSALGHLNVYYIVIQDSHFYTTMQHLFVKLLLIYLFLLCMITLIGYWLSKLFIKPIEQEREKLDRFIKESTHELNTPITTLLMSITTPHLFEQRNIERIRLSAIRISRLYEDLTYLFLQEFDERVTETLSLNDILEEQLLILTPFMKKKNITLVTEVQPLEVIIDKESATRLCSNLIFNAIKYTPMGGEIKVELKERQLSVEDNGIGIEKEQLQHIFKRFHRATHVSGGFGLGLSIVLAICQQFDIGIDVQTEPSVGSKFILTFKP